MCTFWGYHCSTCGNSSPHWFGDGQQLLKEMHEHAEERPNLKGPGLLWCSVMAYLAKHRGHQVCLESEFGELVPVTEGAARSSPDGCLVKAGRRLKHCAETHLSGMRPRLVERWESGEVSLATT